MLDKEENKDLNQLKYDWSNETNDRHVSLVRKAGSRDVLYLKT
jgi:hypothetical protein